MTRPVTGRARPKWLSGGIAATGPFPFPASACAHEGSPPMPTTLPAAAEAEGQSSSDPEATSSHCCRGRSGPTCPSFGYHPAGEIAHDGSDIGAGVDDHREPGDRSFASQPVSAGVGEGVAGVLT